MKKQRFICLDDGKFIEDIVEYNFEEGCCTAIMNDGEMRTITDEDCVKNYQLEEIEND